MSKKFLALILAVTMTATGCSSSWLTTFDGYLQVAGPILVQILDIVALAEGRPVNAALEAKINGDAAALKTLAASISTAAAANLPTVCAEFNQGVATLASDLTAIEQIANIGPTTSGEITAAVGIAQAAIQEIEAPIASCATSTEAGPIVVAHLQLAAVKVTSPEDVVKRFNAVVDKKHQVHLHNRLARWASFGKLQ